MKVKSPQDDGTAPKNVILLKYCVCSAVNSSNKNSVMEYIVVFWFIILTLLSLLYCNIVNAYKTHVLLLMLLLFINKLRV